MKTRRDRLTEEILGREGAISTGDAVVMTRDAYAASIGYEPDGKPMTWVALFDQGQWWRQKSGEWIRVADMAPGHRYNTGAMLMRAAALNAFRYAMGFTFVVGQHDGGEMAHDSLEQIEADLWRQSRNEPDQWLRETTLYKALIQGLTVQGDGRNPWQATDRDPVTGEQVEE